MENFENSSKEKVSCKNKKKNPGKFVEKTLLLLETSISRNSCIFRKRKKKCIIIVLPIIDIADESLDTNAEFTIIFYL